MAIEAKEKERTLKKNYKDKLKELTDTSNDYNVVKQNRLIAFQKFFSSVMEILEEHFKVSNRLLS